MTIHHIPTDEVGRHQPTTGCPCGPTRIYRDGSDRPVSIHHANLGDEQRQEAPPDASAHR